MRGKLAIYLPDDVVKALKLKPGEDVEFAGEGGHFILGRRAVGGEAPKQVVATSKTGAEMMLGDDELSVLKKLDTVRYRERTYERVKQMLGRQEWDVLQVLIRKRFVEPFKKEGETEYH